MFAILLVVFGFVYPHMSRVSLVSLGAASAGLLAVYAYQQSHEPARA